MSYVALIERSVTKAFSLLKDLARPATLLKSTQQEFDFSTLAFPSAPPTETIVSIIFVSELKKSSGKNTMERTVLLQSKGIVDLTTYDAISIDTETWKLGPIIQNSGFVYELKLLRDLA